MSIPLDIAGLRRYSPTCKTQSPQSPSTVHRLFFMHNVHDRLIALASGIVHSLNQMQLMSDHSASLPDRFIPKQTIPVDDPKWTYLIRSHCSKISLTSIARPLVALNSPWLFFQAT